MASQRDNIHQMKTLRNRLKRDNDNLDHVAKVIDQEKQKLIYKVEAVFELIASTDNCPTKQNILEVCK